MPALRAAFPELEGESELFLVQARRSRKLRRTVMAYIALTKPRIIELLLVTTVPAMMLAERGVPSLWLVLATLFGGSLAAGSANALNMYIDRDIDAEMKRTVKRPLVTGEVSPRGALTFGLALGAISVAVLAVLVNPLSAVLALAAILLYVVGYTMILKRRTPQNIVWGGVAGCLPTLIGWSAVTNSLSWAPFVLFGIVFLWTPPHYWPLSMKYKDDYANAGVPMLPVVADPKVVGKQIVAYSWAMVLWSFLLIPAADTGWVYPVGAVLSGGYFLYEAHQLNGRAQREERELKPMRLFHGSITYLTVIFLAVAIDPLLRF
ncbi:heme o synthase [Kineosporia rhizophila]|nr:heme o synthase [Kineosporia sp. NBRC 101677]MCE0538669.1 heme o synthase [Kineosporia rhizophila]GLY19446.1 protoheme IX farnesyltransferase [Kineosporia sp. NBRC 101677]